MHFSFRYSRTFFLAASFSVPALGQAGVGLPDAPSAIPLSSLATLFQSERPVTDEGRALPNSSSARWMGAGESTGPSALRSHRPASMVQPAGGETSTNCNKGFVYSDCDLVFSLIGGVEQSAQSSLPSATTGFLRAFTRVAVTDSSPVNIWGLVRLLGAPTTSSTQGVVSVVSDPSGNLTTQTFATIGTSIDYMVGAEYVMLGRKHDKAYSMSAITGFGGTTPLQANNLALAFQAPAFGTVECNTLLSRFPTQFGVDNIVAGTSTNAATSSCLVNVNKPTGSGQYAPITTIGFSNQDRTSFLGKAVIGVRTIDRFLGDKNTACGDTDATNHIGPCERGIVDWTLGQDASITGGQMRNFVLKVDGVHPLPVANVKFLYIFGTASIRLMRNKDYPPLILQSAAISTLAGTSATAIPNPSAVVLSLVQPNRDFYRFGVGVNINQLFAKLYPAKANPGP